MKNHQHTTTCPIAFSLDHFGDKWSLLIIRDMLFLRKKQYKDFLGSHEKISTNILADRLKSLESTGMITKQADPNNKKQWIYLPTKKGLNLIPILLDLTEWSAQFNPKNTTPKTLIDQIKNNRDTLIATIQKKLEMHIKEHQ